MVIIFNPPSRTASADEKVRSNSPGLAPEIRVQGLPWSQYFFINMLYDYAKML